MVTLTKLLYRPKEAAEILACGHTKLYELLATGELRSITRGRSRLIPADALLEYVNRISSAGEPLARWA